RAGPEYSFRHVFEQFAGPLDGPLSLDHVPGCCHTRQSGRRNDDERSVRPENSSPVANDVLCGGSGGYGWHPGGGTDTDRETPPRSRLETDYRSSQQLATAQSLKQGGRGLESVRFNVRVDHASRSQAENVLEILLRSSGTPADCDSFDNGIERRELNGPTRQPDQHQR